MSPIEKKFSVSEQTNLLPLRRFSIFILTSKQHRSWILSQKRWVLSEKTRNSSPLSFLLSTSKTHRPHQHHSKSRQFVHISRGHILWPPKDVVCLIAACSPLVRSSLALGPPPGATRSYIIVLCDSSSPSSHEKEKVESETECYSCQDGRPNRVGPSESRPVIPSEKLLWPDRSPEHRFVRWTARIADISGRLSLLYSLLRVVCTYLYSSSPVEQNDHSGIFSSIDIHNTERLLPWVDNELFVFVSDFPHLEVWMLDIDRN